MLTTDFELLTVGGSIVKKRNLSHKVGGSFLVSKCEPLWRQRATMSIRRISELDLSGLEPDLSELTPPTGKVSNVTLDPTQFGQGGEGL